MISKLMTTATNNRKLQLARKIVHKSRVRVPAQPKQQLPPPPAANFGEKLRCGGAECCYVQSLIDNLSNFKRSAAPVRVMYYKDGSWVDFEKEVVDLVRAGFVEGRSVVEVGIGGFEYLFDFYRMLLIDFEFENKRSVAWIDVNGKCFFPRRFVGGEFAELSGNSKIQGVEVEENSRSQFPKIEIEIRVGEICASNKRKREDLEKCKYREEAKVEKTEGSSSNDKGKDFKKRRQLVVSDLDSPRWPRAKLLIEGDLAYSIVKNLFLTWLGVTDPGANITAIHQCTRTGPLDSARYEVFQKQLESTKAARGDPKMTLAWYRSSVDDVASILSHGFGSRRKVEGQEAYGVGIYLSPVKSSPASARLSEVEENGENHVILCRVILGKCEKVRTGSQQLYPSSVDFDTGVDDVNNPNWYVVWHANMNTHILPECIVSYKPTHHEPGQLAESSFLKWVPNSANSLTAKFFSKLRDVIPSSKVPELQTLCSTYKEGKVAKDIFTRQLRSIVGDEMMRLAIRETCG